MSFENPLPQDSTETPEQKKPDRSSVGKWARKTAALAGAIGVGYFAGMEKTSADEPNPTKPVVSQAEHQEKTPNIIMVLKNDDATAWGIEYVPKVNAAGKEILASRYFKQDKLTEHTEILGEYDNLIQANKALHEMKDIPEELVKQSDEDVGIIRTEQNFQNSGLVKTDRVAVGQTHVETRHFEGYGLNTTNKVEVDETGKVIKIAE